MQSLEETLVKKIQVASSLAEEKLFHEWKKAETVQERELIYAKGLALKDLQFTIINSIRGNNDG